MGRSVTSLTSANQSPLQRRTCCLSSAWYSWNRDSSDEEHTSPACQCPSKTVENGIEMNIKFSGNSSGGHSCSRHANCTLPLNLRHLWHCVLWQNCTF
jgi:hypothetical protein